MSFFILKLRTYYKLYIILYILLYIKLYLTVEEISVSLDICNYLPLSDAIFPYQEQSENAKPLLPFL